MTATAPKIAVPPGACDCHMHLFDRRFPKAPTALVHPPDAAPADDRAMRDRLGLSRLVVVQPSTYGFDNTCTMEGVAAFAGEARALTDLLADWAPDAAVRRRILVDNPAKLYGFA